MSITSAITEQEQLLLMQRQLWINELKRDVRYKRLTPRTVELFAALFLKDGDTGQPIFAARHHKLWLQFLCDESIKRLMIIAPYGSAKTTWTIQAFAGAYVTVFPERNILTICNAGTTADKRAMAVRSTIASQEYRQLFPLIIPDPGRQWLQNQWSIMKSDEPDRFRGMIHPTFAAYGINGAVIGSRANLILGDDIIDKDSAYSATEREKINTTMDSTVSSRLKKGGRIVIIGTAWHIDDYYSRLRDSGQFLVVHMPMLSEYEIQTPEGIIKEPQKEFYATITYPDNYEGEYIGTPLGDSYA